MEQSFKEKTLYLLFLVGIVGTVFIEELLHYFLKLNGLVGAYIIHFYLPLISLILDWELDSCHGSSELPRNYFHKFGDQIA